MQQYEQKCKKYKTKKHIYYYCNIFKQVGIISFVLNVCTLSRIYNYSQNIRVVTLNEI